MAMIKKLYALQLHKNKWFRALCIVEALLLLWGVAGLFGKDEVYTFEASRMQNQFGSWQEETGGYYVDAAEGLTGDFVDMSGISLKKGVYRVELSYRTDTDMSNLCTVTDDSVGYKSLLTNGGHLYAGLTHTDFLFWLLEDTDRLTVRTEFGGQGSLTVTGLSIYETNALARMWIFVVLCVGLLIDACFVYRMYEKQFGVAQIQKNVAFGLFAVILFASLPLFVDYMISSGDLIYHLMRIEGIKDGILSGQLPVRVAPAWQMGYGYASSVFYGETLLYIAAFFRMIGFTVQTSYRMFMLLINAATALAAYGCFKRIFRDRYAGLLCSALYTLSVYRIYKTYCSGSLGETFGILFLPFLVWGFYRVFTQDIREASYKRSYIPLTIGFCGLIQSHLLTCELVGGFTILLCLVLWKRVLRRETFLVLAKTVIYSAVLSAWFLVPFLDYYLTGDFVIHHVAGRTIQERGLYPAHLFFTFFVRGGNVFFADNGMLQSDPMGVGMVCLAALLSFGLIRFLGKSGSFSETELSFGRICAWFSLLSLVMSLSVFPWDKIQSMNGLTAALVSSLQFPNRCLTIANVLLTGLAGLVAVWFRKNGKRLFTGMYYGLMSVLLFCGSIYLLNDVMFSTPLLRLYNSEGMGSGYVAGGEYLPYGTDASAFTYKAPAGEDLTVEWYEKDALELITVCENTASGERLLELPLLYYKGYQARDLSGDRALSVFAGNNNLVTVEVPAGYQGTIHTEYVSPWYWRAAEGISAAFFILLTGYACVRHSALKRCGKEEEA